MKLAERVIDHPIFSLSDGRKVGIVKDLYFDSDLQAVSGLYLGSEGFFSRTSRVIKADYLKLFGVDVIFVSDSEIVQEAENTPELESWVLRENLQKRAVHSQNGRDVGQVADVMIDDNGTIMGFSLNNVVISGRIAENNSISRSVVIDPGNETNPLQIDQIKAEQPSHQLRIT